MKKNKTNKNSFLSPIVMAYMMSVNYVYANGPTKLLEFIIEMISKGSYAFGAIFGVMGLMKWASAHADGDGPEMKKAQGTLAAAVIVIVVGISLDASKSTLATILAV